MHATQTRYALATRSYDEALKRARAAYPEEPTESLDEATWDAYFEAQEDVDAATGLNAARIERFEAEQALLAWGKTTPSALKSVLDFDVAAKTPVIRDRLIEILTRI